MKRIILALIYLSGLLVMFIPGYAFAEIIPADRRIDWSNVGIPGGIPNRTTICATINASTYGNGITDATIGIQNALNSCPANQVVQLSAGTFLLNGSLSIPSNRVLRGSGANQTILTLAYTGSQAIRLGNGYIPSAFYSTSITTGATDGSTSIVVASASGISVGSYLEISELNAPDYVTIKGGEGNCGWCDASRWGGARARGQIVEVTSVDGTTIGFTPGLYTSYVNALPDWAASTAFDMAASINPSTQPTHVYTQTYNNGSTPWTCTTGSEAPTFPTNGSTVADGTCVWKDQGVGTNTMPLATYFTAAAKYAGLENLQVYSTNAAVDQINISMYKCAYCWLKGVESNYTGGDHVQVWSSYRGEIRDSYFSNAYKHAPGSTDQQIYLLEKTTGFLVENNILERLHVSVNMSLGSAGNVIAYNYMFGNFDSGYDGLTLGHVLMPALNVHGAHPQFNLWEGNITTAITPDNIWGSNSHNTMFRNWALGTSYVCGPPSGRGPIDCSDAFWTFQANRAITIPYLSKYYNLVGNIAGSSQLGSQTRMTEVALVVSPATRAYEYVGYDFNFGYITVGDPTGTCTAGSCPSFSTALMHGNYTNADGAITWADGVTHTLPASLYRTAKPSWFGNIPWPAIGPDVTGGTGPGGHAYAIPAQACYDNTPKDASGMLIFNVDDCYSVSSTILYGDVSENGSVTAYDASLAAQYAVGLITLTSTQITKADVSGNGSVSAYDASLIAQRAVGLIDRFPVEG